MLPLTPWDHLLQTYVDDQGRVNYARWQTEATQDLDRWLASLQTLDPAVMLPDERLALLINLYNALTIQQVLQRYPIHSIRPTLLGIPNWLAFLWFFSRPIYSLRGEKLSLNAIEHDSLRQQFVEPRIHFALVCAAIGCPLLRNEAYRPEIVRAQLDADAHRFIHNPDKVRYDPEYRILYCSPIFKWYGQDFLKVARSIPAFIQQYYPSQPGIAKAQYVQFLPYDWGLNQRTSS